MLTPMIILAIFSIFIGYITKDIYLGFGSPFHSIFTHPDNLSIVDIEMSLPTSYKLLPLFLTIFSVISVIFIYEFKYTLLPSFTNSIFYNIYLYANSKFMIDQIINNIILRSGLYSGLLLSQFVDKGLLHVYGPTGLFKGLNYLSTKPVLSFDSLSGYINNISSNINPLIYSSSPVGHTPVRFYGIFLLSLLFVLSFFIFSSSYILILLLLISV